MSTFEIICLAIDAGGAIDNALVNGIRFINWIGPGCGFAFCIYLAYWACDVAADHRHKRREAAAQAREHEPVTLANLGDHLEPHWQQLTTDIRKGNQQP